MLKHRINNINIMVELETCKNFSCNNKFVKKNGRMYCSKECTNVENSLTWRSAAYVRKGYSIEELKKAMSLSKDAASHYYEKSKSKLRQTQYVLTTKIKDSGRINDEEYLINSPFFYLNPKDRIQPIETKGQTIKEYLESSNI